VPEMGVRPPEGKQSEAKPEAFEAELEVIRFVEDEKLKVQLI